MAAGYDTAIWPRSLRELSGNPNTSIWRSSATVKTRPTRKEGCLVRIVSIIAAAIMLTQPAQSVTFAVRPAHGLTAGPEELLANNAVGDRFCYSSHCIVRASTVAQVAALEELHKNGRIDLEPLPEADQLLFANATYDVSTNSYDRAFPGLEDEIEPSGVGSFVVVFKSYPEQSWLDTLRSRGLAVLEPMPAMGYGVYGDRDDIQSLPRLLPYVVSTLELPPGIKRLNLDEPLGLPDEPGPTTFVVPTDAASSVLALFSTWKVPPARAYSTGSTVAYTASLCRADAILLSRRPEILSIARERPGHPSDERTNRIIGGQFLDTGSAWPSTLPTNTSPYYWDSYLADVNLNLNSQKIGLFDTGVGDGLQADGTSVCPPHLTPDSGACRLVFTADAFTTAPNDRGDDQWGHGTLVTSVAAGINGVASNGRDTHGYAFSQGVCADAQVAMFKAFACDGSGYRIFPREVDFNSNNMPALTRYGIVEMSATVALPDAPSVPGVALFNHSWNIAASYGYDASSRILDQATRDLSAISFDFGTSPEEEDADVRKGASGDAVPSLHVVSAGNIGGDPIASVTSPGTAKNVLTVGATETYNDEGYTAGCGNNNGENANDPHQIAAFSRTGFPNQRLKPDLVAPGTRVYGRRSSLYGDDCAANPLGCNSNLDGYAQYLWSAGTSFSAPAVAGAAAMTRQWLTSASLVSSPSPAIIKATLIATATNLVPCAPGCSTCSVTGDMRPAPDKYQGWGGVSLARLFGSAANYYFHDEGSPLTYAGDSWTHTATIADATEDIFVALVWTDRHSDDKAYPLTNLVNDLDLEVSFTDSQGTHKYYGNVYYDSIDSCDRDGFSMKDPTSFTRDRGRNNVEKVSVRRSDIPSGVTSFQIKVTAFSLTGDGVDVNGSTLRQDFAVMAYNLH